jgi:DNA-directed RNA polymerase subunit RPC12/RpoP
MYCSQCGSKAEEAAAFCSQCGAKILISEEDTQNKYQRLLTTFFKLSKIGKAIVIAGVAIVAVTVIIILVSVISLVFSSIISVAITIAIVYIVYHLFIAVYITQYIYNKDSKVLQLPEDMSAQTLFEALSGKFNYPYFKGVRYGENGECIIEGQYSIYSVIFDINNEASLSCQFEANDKKARTIMLEAIAVRHYINKFFNPSLPFDAVIYYNSLKSAERQRKVVASVISLIIIGALVFQYVLPGGLQRIITPGAEIRNAYLTEYSTRTTIGKAFDNFFDNGKWSTYTERDGRYFVVFTGTCYIHSEITDIRITFQILTEHFVIDRLEVDGRVNNFLLHSLLTAVYDEVP